VQHSPDRAFHLVKPEYGAHTLARAQENGQLTDEDVGFIRVFVAELESTRNIGVGRANKITFALTSWRKFIGPYRMNTLPELYAGIALLKAACIKGRPYKQNTIRDYLLFLKRFYRGLIENGLSDLPRAKIDPLRA